MTRLMYDTTDIPPVGVPHTAQIVAGYINGRYRSFGPLVAWCPDAEHVSIAVTTQADADVLDIEQGDATPAGAPGWVDRQLARGLWQPTLYCERSQWDEVKAAVGNRNVAYWVADYTGAPHYLPGAVAVQYVNHGPNNENVDLSLVTDDGWPHRTSPQPEEEDEMYVLSFPNAPYLFIAPTGLATKTWIQTPDDLYAMAKAPTYKGTLSLSQAQVSGIPTAGQKPPGYTGL